MSSRSASSRPTKTSVLPSTEIFQPLETGTRSDAVIFREVVVPPTAPAGAIDIDAFVAEFEQSREGSEALAKGRQWVADTFYTDALPSIAKLRLQKGWSQAEFARRAGTSQSYIGRLEQGKVDPQLSTVRRIANALNTPLAVAVQAISLEAEQ